MKIRSSKGRTKKEKDFRDEYSDYEKIPTREEFIGLFPYLWHIIKKLASITAQIGKAILSVFSYVQLPLIIIIVAILLYVAAEILPKRWADYRHSVAVAELQTKDYLVTALRRVCYQKYPLQHGKSTCLTTQGAVLSSYSWYASFKRYNDNKLSITVTLKVDRDEKKYPIEFHKAVNGVGIWNTKWKFPKPFSCSHGTWRFIPGSVHEKAKSKLSLNPKIKITSKGCPDYLLTFPIWW